VDGWLVVANTLIPYAQDMILIWGRVLLEIGDAMRVLCCLLLGSSVLLSGCGGSKEAAVAAIKKLGGFVSFEENNPGKPVVHVSLFGQDVTDASLEHLKELTSLTSLDLVNTRVTEAGLEHLKGLTPNVRSRGAENSV
jgi:hypothetical protein